MTSFCLERQVLTPLSGKSKEVTNGFIPAHPNWTESNWTLTFKMSRSRCVFPLLCHLRARLSSIWQGKQRRCITITVFCWNDRRFRNAFASWIIHDTSCRAPACRQTQRRRTVTWGNMSSHQGKHDAPGGGQVSGGQVHFKSCVFTTTNHAALVESFHQTSICKFQENFWTPQTFFFYIFQFPKIFLMWYFTKHVLKASWNPGGCDSTGTETQSAEAC